MTKTGAASSNPIDAEVDRLAQDAYDQLLRAAQGGLHGLVAARVPLGFDATAGSYYSTPSRSRMTPADMELDASDSPAAFMAAIAAHWQRQGLADLVEVCGALQRIAELLQSSGAEEADEVSAFVYAMY